MKVLCCPKCGAECSPAYGYNQHVQFHPEEGGYLSGTVLIDCDECFTTFVYRYVAYIETEKIQTMKEAFGL